MSKHDAVLAYEAARHAPHTYTSLNPGYPETCSFPRHNLTLLCISFTPSRTRTIEALDSLSAKKLSSEFRRRQHNTNMASTGLSARQESAFRRKQLSVSQREQLLKPFLPAEPTDVSEQKSRVRQRPAQPPKQKRPGPIKGLLFFAVHHIIALLFSIFFRFRRAFRLVYTKLISLLRYHHRTPEFIAGDVSHLEKLPKHLSVVVELNDDDEQQGNAGLEGLVNDVCEIAAWSASAGITFLSVYERTGICFTNHILN